MADEQEWQADCTDPDCDVSVNSPEDAAAHSEETGHVLQMHPAWIPPVSG